jgi:hypothetical protein
LQNEKGCLSEEIFEGFSHEESQLLEKILPDNIPLAAESEQ